MNNQPIAFFFEIEPISEDSILWKEFQQQKIFFSYFQVKQKYYLFFYSQKPIDIDRIEPFIHIIDELDRKQRKIRSLRGSFLYLLEIFEQTNNSQILNTNFQPSFWRKLKTILRQNKKTVLLEFLFGSQESIASTEVQNDLKDKIESLENQVNSLQHKIIELENEQTLHKSTLSELLNTLKALKINQQDVDPEAEYRLFFERK